MKNKILHKVIIILLAPFFMIGAFCQTKLIMNNNPISILLDISTQRPVLRLMINDTGPYRFIFDTGSSTNVIDQELANKLGLEVIGEDPLQTPGSDNKLMSKRVLISKVTISGIELAEEVVMNTVAIRNLLSVDGVLCPNAFVDYLITIDYSNSDLILSSDELNAAGYLIFKDLKITIDNKNNLIRFEKSSSTTGNEDREEYSGAQNDYTGWYGDHARKIFIENGEMYLQRGGASKLKLVKISKDKFEMVFDMPVKNELPAVNFERDETNQVIGLKFLFEDGREDFVQKDK
ncbi:MAG: retropepsin-like aspartic protease [Ignavibacteriaceae bacterium]